MLEVIHNGKAGGVFIIRGEVGDAEKAVIQEIERSGISFFGNPDCLRYSFEVCSVDEARAIASFSIYAPVGEKKYLIVSARSITKEAQNALLKVTEEGVGKSVFVFILPRGASVLPTLLSRSVVIDMSSGRESAEEGARALVARALKDRVLFAEELAKNQDREGAERVVEGLLSLCEKNEIPRTALRDLIEADQLLRSPGSSIKHIMGYLAVVL